MNSPDEFQAASKVSCIQKVTQVNSTLLASPSPSTNFSSLPIELRHKIWNLTFEPRTLSICIHSGQTPANALPSAAMPFFDSQPLKPVCETFTAYIGVIPPFSHRPPNQDPGPFRGHFTIRESMKVHPPPGPLALNVCHESRQLALKRYELYFAGTNLIPRDMPFKEEWVKGRFGEKRIWVDFKRDVIFIFSEDGQLGRCGHPHSRPFQLDLFAEYAKEEVGKIARLAIAGTWYGLKSLGGMAEGPFGRAPMGPDLMRRLMEGMFGKFRALKELVVWHSDMVILNRHYVKRSSEQVKREILDVLRKEKERDVEWTAELPVVTILRDFEAKISEDGTHFLRDETPHKRYYAPMYIDE